MENLIDKPDYEIYREFKKEHNLKNVEVTFDPEHFEYKLSFDQEDIIPTNIWQLAMFHFDMSRADTKLKYNGERITITLQV